MDAKISSTKINKNHSDLASVYAKRQNYMTNFMEENKGEANKMS